MKLQPLTVLLLTTLVSISSMAHAKKFAVTPEIKSFIDEMATKHQYERTTLQNYFGAAELREDVLKAISSPAERKPWHEYRPIFITDTRINKGVEFWQEHAQLLTDAQRKYGVSAATIVAIIGVETFYGTRKGNHLVFDALATLAFEYPPRSAFFRSELAHFLLLCEEQDVDPRSVKGSYAGAMGIPQFIASSYRHYAVDFDNDGKKNLWDNPADAIGSVANYLSTHHWQPGGPVAVAAQAKQPPANSLLATELKPATPVRTLRKHPIEFDPSIADESLSNLVKLEGKHGDELWVTLHNFYVITRYNRSTLYAMAVTQLAEEIQQRRAAAQKVVSEQQ